MDNISLESRKKNMRNIKSKNTKPEITIASKLKQKKIYFKTHDKSVFGTPDIIFKRKKIAVFIDSDFWHCNPKKFIMPSSNTEYWKNKILNNIKRDRAVTRALIDKKWIVLRFWESNVKKRSDDIVDLIIKLKNSR
jgi:DNA mismatch endonuclease (patch repair protein)